ncbi:DUF2283 domain-containing protein [Acidithiobacillus ferriphilus]|uniref:DUF2283 domain-containing protein n=1 Tax=Acidithiobacillus ferriphilus TaxID=1689834 RepID=UPI001D00F562|nr:DUF2283 domain-containing protein [Acidithiobacillus ferriphilus]
MSNRDRNCLQDQQDFKILEAVMKVRYDPETDTLTMRLSEHPVTESDEAGPGIILDYDNQGNIVGIEILNASKNGADTRSIEYAFGT